MFSRFLSPRFFVKWSMRLRLAIEIASHSKCNKLYSISHLHWHLQWHLQSHLQWHLHWHLHWHLKWHLHWHLRRHFPTLEAKLEAKDSRSSWKPKILRQATSLFIDRCLKKTTSFALQLCFELLKMSLGEGEGVALLLLNAGSSRDRSPCIHMRLVAYTWVCCIRLFFNTCRPLFKQRLTCIQKVAKKTFAPIPWANLLLRRL